MSKLSIDELKAKAKELGTLIIRHNGLGRLGALTAER